MTRLALQLILFCFLWAGDARAQASYERDETADAGGASWSADVELAPLFLVETYGAPAAGDGLRVSGWYTFRAPEGAVFTIHDYKQTSLWAGDEGLPPPEAFWRSDRPVELTVGSRLDASDPALSRFKRWLLAAYESWRRRRPD